MGDWSQEKQLSKLENVFYYCMYILIFRARTTCMYLCNKECNVNHVLRVCTYATKNPNKWGGGLA